MDSILSKIRIEPQEYKSKFPYSYGAQDKFIDEDSDLFIKHNIEYPNNLSILLFIQK